MTACSGRHLARQKGQEAHALGSFILARHGTRRAISAQSAHRVEGWVYALPRRLEQEQVARESFAAALQETSRPTRLCSLWSALV